MTQASGKAEKLGQDRSAGGEVASSERLGRLQSVASRLPQRLIVALIFLIVALGFNLYRLGDPSIWFDEAFSVELARQPLPLLWHIIFGPEPNMELYYLFLHFWLGLTGLLGMNPTEVVVRFPSAIFAALSTVVVFLLGWRFVGRTTGVVGAGLYLLNAVQLTYAQQARGYSLQLLFICIAWYALLSALTCTAHPRRWWLCYVVAMALAVYTHLFSILILLAQVVAVAGLLILPSRWRQQTRQQASAFGISIIATGVLIVPMLLEARQGARTGWLPVPHLGDLIHLFATISDYDRPYLIAVAIFCMLAVVVVVLAYGMRRLLDIQGVAHEGHAIDRELLPFHNYAPVTWALLCWFVIPIVVSYVVSHGSIRLFSSRYLVTIVPPLFLLVGIGVTVLRWRIVKIVLALGLVALALSAVPLYYRSAQVEDWNSTTHWLEQQYRDGDGLVCYDNTMQPGLQQGCQIAVEYYLHAYPSAAHFTDDSPGAFSWANYGLANPAVTAGYDAAVDPADLAVFAARHQRIFYIVGRVRDDAAAAREQAAQRWLDGRYHFVAQIVTRTVTIRLYDTSPNPYP